MSTPPVKVERRGSTYDPESVGTGIVHIGLGAFHRAHQAVYIESGLNRHGGGDWGICAASIRSNLLLIDQLAAQHYRYHVAEYRNRNDVRITEVNAIREALFAARDKRALLERMTAPATRIVSLTITEKGYHLEAASGELKLDDPGVARDLDDPASPGTVPGLLLEALRRRRSLGIDPFTVLCCDNMPANGKRVRRAVVTMAERQNPDLADWILGQVAFPCSMVDRIVPAVTLETTAGIETLLGYSDPVAVATEAFSQWVVEDRFPGGRPDWEADGVQMVADVATFETMKLRLLNGAHSLLAYVGLARGKTTVAEAIADPDLGKLVQSYFAEARTSLQRELSTNLDGYCEALLARFRNDALEHRLEQIAMDGSQKIPQRWLDGALINLEQGRNISATAKAVAAWLAYVRGEDQSGQRWQVDDPMADRLRACLAQPSADAVIGKVLGMREVFSEQLAARDDFRAAVRSAYEMFVHGHDGV